MARLVRELEAPGANMRTGGVLKGSTIDNVLTALSGVFALAVRRGWAQANPVGGLLRSERPKTDNRPKRILSPDEIRRVVEAAGERWRVFVMVAVFTGLRQAEQLGLTWVDVDLDAGRLSVRWQLERGTHALVEPKTANAVREVPLPAFLVRALREHKLASHWSLDEHPVFASDVGGHIGHRNVGRAWSRIRGETRVAKPGRGRKPLPGAGLSGPLPVFNDLRHTAASL
jgi:integrase